MQLAVLLAFGSACSALPSLANAGSTTRLSAPPSAERWAVWEANLTHSTAAIGNPFLDVQLEATFKLASALSNEAPPAPPKTQPPEPLVALEFGAGTETAVPNHGTSKASAPSAEIIAAHRSRDVPAGGDGSSMDFGSDVAARHVVELPGDKKPFEGGLAGLATFTISGWLRVDAAGEGDGGNRVVNYCKGGPGIDLVWVNTGGGQLKLAVNEWPDGAHPVSSRGSIPVSAGNKWPEWHFFAVTYDAALASNNVRWYFGTSRDAATLDAGAANSNYSRGVVGDPHLPLAFGNFGSGFHANDRLLRGRLFDPKVFGSALSIEEIVATQNRSGCRPTCGAASCGSDGCGGSCGVCGVGVSCGNLGGGPRRCQSPTTLTAEGFYDGNDNFKIRFSPPYEGRWSFVVKSNIAELSGHEGVFQVTAAAAGHHGPVESQRTRFVHADGTPYFSVGSTSYQWTSKTYATQDQTLRTLAGMEGSGGGKVFNKLRMTVFPKWYVYNHANPVEAGTAYEIMPGSVAANATAWGCQGQDCPSTKGSFDLTRFNVSYWRNYERLLRSMQQSGVIADIIIFHPYDGGHWGFDCMGGPDPAQYNTTYDELYLRYLVARFAAFDNVWWSMANEWSDCSCKSLGMENNAPTSHNNGFAPTWDALFRTLASADPYGRQTSIHNGPLLYNHSMPYITHVSLQGHEDDTPALLAEYGKPTIWDEVQYEGNITSGWGALSGEEMTDRFFWGASLGVHVGHSETVLRHDIAVDDDQPLWWAKGGTLVGMSPPKIKWFRELWENNSSRPEFGSLSPYQTYCGDADTGAGYVANVLSSADFLSLHFLRPGRWSVPLEGMHHTGATTNAAWEVRKIDYWARTVTKVAEVAANASHIQLDVPEIPGNYEILRAGTIWHDKIRG